MTVDGKPVAATDHRQQRRRRRSPAADHHAVRAASTLSGGSHAHSHRHRYRNRFRSRPPVAGAATSDGKALALTASGPLPGRCRTAGTDPAHERGAHVGDLVLDQGARPTQPFGSSSGEPFAGLEGHGERPLAGRAHPGGRVRQWLDRAGRINLPINLSWTPQHRVDIALLISAIGVALCLRWPSGAAAASLVHPSRARGRDIDLRQPAGRRSGPLAARRLAVVISGAFGPWP